MNKPIISVFLVSTLLLVSCSQSTGEVIESTIEGLSDQEASIETTQESSIETEATTALPAKTQGSLQDSVAKLINPSEEYVIECLQNVEQIETIEAVTEAHDPNGNLGKQGGYTAAIYFTISLIEVIETDYGYAALVNDEKNYISIDENGSVNSPVDLGTACGGQIEVYATVEDAQKRDRYLSTFDGGPLSNGSHYVYGSMVIRTSDYLWASQQQELTDEIVTALKNG